MAVQHDVDLTRRAVHALEQAARTLTRHFGDTVDTRRLHADIGRLEDDIDLLCGKALPNAPSPCELEIVEDKEYGPDFWAGAEDEGLGAPDRRTR
jgi:hypothetical protein